MIDVGSIWGDEGMRFDNSFAIAVWLTLFILIISTVIFILIILRARTNRNWQEAATELGLNFTPSNLLWLPYEMNGTLDGGYYCRVHTWREHRSGGSSSGSNAPVTGVEVRFLESLRMGFNLSPCTGIKWFDSLMGVDDTEVGGDPDFDQMFAISSTDDMKLKRFLTAERKEILKAATTEMPYFEITDSGISTEANEMIRDKESIVHIVMSFKELAMDLTSDGGEQEPDIFAKPSISESSKSIFD